MQIGESVSVSAYCSSKKTWHDIHNASWRDTLADPDLQKLGGQIFDEIFQRPFLGISRKNFFIPQKIPHVFPPKFLTTFF